MAGRACVVRDSIAGENIVSPEFLCKFAVNLRYVKLNGIGPAKKKKNSFLVETTCKYGWKILTHGKGENYCV